MADADWLAVLTVTDGYDLTAPVPSGALAHVEESLGASIPSGLRALYEVTDGVLDKPGEWQVIWTVEELSRRNLAAYGIEESSRHEFIAFGDDGTGEPILCQSRRKRSRLLLESHRPKGDLASS